MSLNIYYAKDADPTCLSDQKIAILGYGSQGRAHALNLKDSGFEVMVGVRADGNTMERAISDGVQAGTVEQACQGAGVIAFLFPDPSQPKVFNEIVAPSLKPGQIILVAHGFNLHYGQMVPPPEVDVVMIAPKGPGNLVRELYKMGQGIPSLLAVHQDASGRAKEFALAYAHGLGATRAGVVQTTIQEETETDLFGEQAVICGGMSSLIKAGFDTLVEAGYAPEMAFFECCHEMKLIVDLVYQGGMRRMRKFISDTAKYGDMTRGPRVIDARVRETMKEILSKIQNGEFAREWVLENQVNRPVYNAHMETEANLELDRVGDRMRAMMGWLD